MPSSPVPIGKRPEFKHSRSAAWSWPRLVPIHEQQSRLSQANQPSASPSLRDHSELEEPSATMVSTVASSMHAGEDAPGSPAVSTASRSPTPGGSVAESVYQPPDERPRESLSSKADIRDEKRGAANRKVASSASSSVENVADERSPGSEREFVEDVAEKKSSGSDRGSVESVAEESASPSERPLGDTVDQGDTEIPVGYESTITDVPLKDAMPATSLQTSIPPVMDRISAPCNAVPYYATPKIMIHKPSQSSESENTTPPTSDEILANETQSQERTSQTFQPPQHAPDSNLTDATPMQSMSLRPIAWQAPKDQKIQKRKLYLRKVRNAAARKTILKATLGRQLAIPTKQMLRLLANGENLTVPGLSQHGVEASAILVPQEAVGSVTGAIMFPQGVAGAVSNG